MIHLMIAKHNKNMNDCLGALETQFLLVWVQ